LVAGGPGDDIASGGVGNDLIGGGQGNDILYGSQGNNTLSGGAGDDRVGGGPSRDRIFGFSGNDTLFGLGDQDQINAGIGTDIVFGNSGDDRLSGGAGSDSVSGGAGSDSVSGGAGSDVIASNGGADKVLAGAGDDILVADYIISSANGTHDVPDGAVDSIACGDGNDTAFLSIDEGDTVESDCENVNPTSFDIQSEGAMSILSNATENSQSNRVDIEQNCELAVAQSNGVLSLDLCQKIKISLNENPTFVRVPINSTEAQLEFAGNISQVCPDVISKGSDDDVALDICNSFISQSANQTNIP
jgi:hypothetical protein